MLVEINNKTKSKINLKLIEQVVKKFLSHYNLINKEVSIAFVGDRVIKNLNKKYRQIDKITDILSFSGDNDFLGEIIINYNQIKKQAKKNKKTVKQELIFVLIHGLLHLIGYDDQTEKDRKNMMNFGEQFIKNNLR